MGKIRVNTIGDESLEQKQKIDAEKRQEAKKVAKAEEPNESKETKGESKKEIEKTAKAPSSVKTTAGKSGGQKKKLRSPRYIASKKFVEKSKQYKIIEALDVLSQMQKTKFDETVELHINTIEKGVSGNVTLPHGTGKKTRVAIISPTTDAAGAEKLLKDIAAGKIEFEVLIATPDAMPKLAKVAIILGPKGLMPNPKAGTVTAKPQELAKKYAGGQIAYKTEAKSPIIHVSVGKMSFGKEKLAQNIDVFITSIDRSKLKNAYIKSTMSPSLRLVI